MAVRKIVTLDAFTSDDDPHREHGFGNVERAGLHLGQG
jgi:hypothetical protein